MIRARLGRLKSALIAYNARLERELNAGPSGLAEFVRSYR